MKLIVTQKNLNKGLLISEKVVGKNLTLPILQNILLTCEKSKGYAKLSSTDLEVGVEILIPAKIEEEGNVTVPAKIFSEFVRNLPEEKVEIEYKNNQLFIKCGSFSSSIKTESSKEFPIIPNIEEENVISIKTSDFLEGLSAVIGSVSTLDIKPEISGIFVQFKKNDIYFVGTDSFRLSEKVITTNNENVAKVIVPRKTSDIIIKIFEDLDDQLKIQINSNQITVKNNPKENPTLKVKLVSRVIDGDYPNYEQIVPSNFTTLLEVNKDSLIKHVKAASIFSSKINDVTLKINSKKQEVNILSKDQEFGSQSSLMPSKVEGDDMEITFNFVYLLDGLNSLSSPKVSIKLNKDNTPALISSLDDKDFKYVLMPIKN